MINIDYEKAIDFEHINDLNESRERLSILTNILNKIIIVRQTAKKDVLTKCSTFQGEALHKLSWDNKLVRLSELLGNSELCDLWCEADIAYRQVKNKQSQVLEDLLALKKMVEVTPR